MLFVNGATGGKTNIFIAYRLFGIPVLLMDYIGALKAWFYYPIFAIFGVNVWSVRLPAILLGTAGSLMLVAALWRGFGPRAALAGAVMILLDPTTIIHTRLDWGPNAFMFFFRGLLMLSMVSWIRTQSIRWAWIAVIAAALGIFDKLNFIWMAGAAMGSLVIVYAGKLKTFTRNHPTHALVLTGIATGGLAAAVVRGIMVAEHVDLGWGDRLNYAFGLLQITIPGGGALNFIAGDGARVEKWFWSGYLLAIPVGIFGIRLLRKNDYQKRLLIWLVVLTGLVLMAFVLTKTATGPHHASMLCGLWQCILAPLVAMAWDKLKTTITPGKIAYTASLALVAVGSIIVVTTCLRAFAKPINPNWNPSCFQAAMLAQKYPNANFICTDWGMGTLAVGLSKQRINIHDEWPAFMNRDGAVNVIKSINREQDTYIYTSLPGFENFKGNRDNLQNALQVNNLNAQKFETYNNWEGKPMIEVLYIPADH
jgi:4-amino-4-deoxy-L-arabinose transferase-like glycosyltransferase